MPRSMVVASLPIGLCVFLVAQFYLTIRQPTTHAEQSLGVAIPTKQTVDKAATIRIYVNSLASEHIAHLLVRIDGLGGWSFPSDIRNAVSPLCDDDYGPQLLSLTRDSAIWDFGDVWPGRCSAEIGVYPRHVGRYRMTVTFYISSTAGRASAPRDVAVSAARLQQVVSVTR